MALTKAHNRMIKGSMVNVLDYGAVGDGSTDDTSAINLALAAGKSVYFPTGTYLITSTIVVPQETHIVGEDNRRSIIYVDSDINGLDVSRFTTLDNIRVLGTSSMSSSKGLILLGYNSDSAHTRFYNCTIGGQDTAYNDPVSEACGGAGVIGGNTFLNQFYSCFFYKCNKGYFNTASSGSTVAFAPANNNILFSGCSFSSNTDSGVEIDIPQGIVFDDCDFENNGRYGIIALDARATTIQTCYFENNGWATAGANPNADIRLTAGSGGTTNVTIKDCFFLRGVSGLTRAVDIDSQNNIELSGCYFNNYSATGVLAVEITNSSGSVANCYTSGSNNVQAYSLSSGIFTRELFSTQSAGQIINPVEGKTITLNGGYSVQVTKYVTSSANINAVLTAGKFYTVNNDAGYDIYLQVPNPVGLTGQRFTVVKDGTSTTGTISVYSPAPASYPIVGASAALGAAADGTAVTLVSDGTSWVVYRSAP